MNPYAIFFSKFLRGLGGGTYIITICTLPLLNIVDFLSAAMIEDLWMIYQWEQSLSKYQSMFPINHANVQEYHDNSKISIHQACPIEICPSVLLIQL